MVAVEVGAQAQEQELPGADEFASLSDDRAEEEFIQLQRSTERLQLERARRLGDLDRRGIHARDGHVSTEAWLVARFTMGWGEAKRLLASARGLERMPETQAALGSQEISPSALKLLVRAREVDPAAFARDESSLVQAARHQSIADLSRTLGHWRLLAEQERYPDLGERQQALRAVPTSAGFCGMTRAGGELTPEVAEWVLTALAAVMDAEAHAGGPDERTAAQRRHDAIGVICRAYLDSSDRPSVGGERPHLNVVVSLDSLTSGTGTAEADHVGAVAITLARQLACDASVRRIVMGPGSEPLDAGRATPVVPAALRRAVVARDRHCRFPRCDRPPGWCEAHHVVHWADGGETSLANLVLMCRRHHGIVHARGGCSLGMEDAHPVFRRADGSVLEDRGPPG